MSDSPNPQELISDAIAEHLAVIGALRNQEPVLRSIGEMMDGVIAAGNKVLWCGNGGSAADAQHLAAELVGRFRRERRAMMSIALTTDTSILTAIGNDYGYEYIFERQIEALCKPGDVAVGISTSGNSQNVIRALMAAKTIGAFTVAFTGQGGGQMAELAQWAVRIQSKNTARIQEGHILCGHILCDWIEACACTRAAKEAAAQPI
jgi:D-sedoheptulose 7-phosphate isomerase